MWGGMSLTLVRYSEQPELWEDTDSISREVWPEYNQHGDVLNEYWGRLFDEFPQFQFLLYDADAEAVVAEGHTAPVVWDRTPDGLGSGIDDVIATAFEAPAKASRSMVLCALAAEIRPRYQRRGLARTLLDAMAEIAGQAHMDHLIAPVRPSLKERYPITPIERYVRWTLENGEPFDPWIRTHTRRGGSLVKPAPCSLRITGTTEEWEEWTSMRFPDDGRYTFPHGLSTLQIERGNDLGSYWEPNVWIVHPIHG